MATSDAIRDALRQHGVPHRYADGTWSLRRTVERYRAVDVRIEMARAVREVLGVTSGRFREHLAAAPRDIHVFYDFDPSGAAGVLRAATDTSPSGSTNCRPCVRIAVAKYRKTHGGPRCAPATEARNNLESQTI